MTHLLISLVLTVVIWILTFASRGSSLQLLLLIGSVWATIDFLRALWRYARAEREPEEDEPSAEG